MEASTNQARVNAAIAEFRRQREMLGDRSAELALELAEAQLQIAALQNKVIALEAALKEREDVAEQA